jgi:hypothetical protein
MKFALKGTMQFEMSQCGSVQKPLWDVCFCIGTLSADFSRTETISFDETAKRKVPAHFYSESAGQTARIIQGESVPLFLRAL